MDGQCLSPESPTTSALAIVTPIAAQTTRRQLAFSLRHVEHQATASWFWSLIKSLQLSASLSVQHVAPILRSTALQNLPAIR
jgi:hypothetical protein